MPQAALKVAQRDLKRLKKMSPQMPEYPMLRHYIELLSELPWSLTSDEKIDLEEARKVNEKKVRFRPQPFFASIFLWNLRFWMKTIMAWRR